MEDVSKRKNSVGQVKNTSQRKVTFGLCFEGFRSFIQRGHYRL